MTIAQAGKASRQSPAPPRRRAFGRPSWAAVALFCLPGLALFVTFALLPLLTTMWYSLFRWQGTANAGFAGLRNFVDVATTYPLGEDTARALWHNVVFFVGTMLVQNSVSLLLAVLLHRNPWGKRFFQTIFSIPYLISPLVVGYIWSLMLSPRFGPINALLAAVGLESWQQAWLGQSELSMPILILVNAWQWVGGPMLILGAGLAGIPHELEEAASLDGANAWQTFWRVRFPLLMPSVGVVTVLTFIGCFNTFDVVYSLGGSQGGPGGAMDVLALLFYRTAFRGGANAIGNSSALAVGMFVLIFGIAILLDRVLRRREVTE